MTDTPADEIVIDHMDFAAILRGPYVVPRLITVEELSERFPSPVKDD